MEATVVLPYFGSTTIKNLRPLVNVINSSNPVARIVLHRDRDYLTDEETNEWATRVRALKVEPFLTDGTDIESHFLVPAHLAELNSVCDKEGFDQIISKVAVDNHQKLVERFVNGRVEIERRQGTYGQLNVGQLAAEAPTKIENDPVRFRHGKTMLASVRQEFRVRYGNNLRDIRPTQNLENGTLRLVARKVFK